MRAKKLPRRSFLKGAAGGVSAAIALPYLDAMRSTAKAQTSGPRRFLISYGGVLMKSSGTPTGSLAAGGFRGCFTPLAGLENSVSIASGLSVPRNGTKEDSAVPPGGQYPEQHARVAGPMITGVRSQNAACFRGPSADQIVADAVGTTTPFPSLQYRVQPHGYSGAGERGGFSSSASGMIAPISDPALAYNQLVQAGLGSGGSGTGGGSTGGGGTPMPSQELLRDRSVLDIVLESGNRLMSRLGATDRVRMEQHLEEIREVERRLAALLNPPSGGGRTPPAPSASCARPASPGTIPVDTGALWSREDERGDIFAELAALAFACDLTRSISLMITWDQCQMTARNAVGVDERMHQIGHNGTFDEKEQVTAWNVEQFGKVLRALQNKNEDGVPLLERTFASFMVGEGPGPHSASDLEVVFAGPPDVLRMGEYIAASGHPAQLLIAGMQAVGVNTDTLGEVNGALSAVLR